MFTCSACLRRAFESLAHDTPSTSNPHLFVRSLSSQSVPRHHPNRRTHTNQSPLSVFSRRNHTSLASLRKGHHRQGYNEFLGKKKDVVLGSKRRKAPLAFTKKEKRDALAREKNRLMMRNRQADENEPEDENQVDFDNTLDNDDDIVRPSQARADLVEKKVQPRNQSADRKALGRAIREVEKYYKDPLQLANGVVQRLRVPDIDGALRLVHASEHFHIQNIVSWNHCIDFLMGQGETRQATKVYNEMKKRGRKPDAHTYTIMLRGYSRNVKQPHAVQDAVKVYNSIFAPNSAVKPSTIHTNAIINVCARGGDMDALWAVAGRLPERGPGSPDRWTYTTIFNAIRENAIKEASKLVDKIKTRGDREEAEQVRTTLFEQALEDGRKLWEDVNYRWRRANLVLDEQLVCSMGRLILGCGKEKDLIQIFDLVDTTMNLHIPERRGIQQASWLQLEIPLDENHNAESEVIASSPRDADLDIAKLKKSQLPLNEANVYAQPSNNTLSLILDACNLIPTVKHWAESYWHLLTSSNGPFSIHPDANNIIAYLRVLRRNRASRQTYRLLDQSWPADVAKLLYKRATFVIAFSTCLRDKNNPNVFDTAVKLLGLMEEKLEERALGMFDEGLAILEKRGKERRTARKQHAQEIANATIDDAEETFRQNEGIQSLRVDPKSLRYFLDLAMATTPGWNEGIRFKDAGEVFPRQAAQNNTIIALRMVAPLTVSLKRLVQLKMEEMQIQHIPRPERVSKKELWDPRTGTRVGERTEELLELMRIMVSAYDRILTTADRFEAQGLEQIDKKIIKEFDNARRQFAGYMGKIDRDLTSTFRAMTVANEDAVEAEDIDENDIEVISGRSEVKPQILQKLESIYSSVDRQILDDRHANRDARTIHNKGYRHARFDGSAPTQLKLNSRIQAKERENLLNQQMQRQFPVNDYGSLDENLVLIENEALRKKSEAMERRKAFGLRKGPRTELATPNDLQGELSGTEQEDQKVEYKELKRDEQPATELIDALVNNPEFEDLSEEEKQERASQIMLQIEQHREDSSLHTEAEKWYSYANDRSKLESTGEQIGEDDSTEVARNMMDRERRRVTNLQKSMTTEGSAILANQSVRDAWTTERERGKEDESNVVASGR